MFVVTTVMVLGAIVMLTGGTVMFTGATMIFTRATAISLAATVMIVSADANPAFLGARRLCQRRMQLADYRRL